MFFETDSLPGISALQRDWLLVRAEFDAAREGRFVAWTERHIYDGDWGTLFLLDGYKGKKARRVDDNYAAFPLTSHLLDAVPGVLSAGFSRLGPKTRIQPHRGFDRHVVRIHLGIKVPPDCWLAVRWERREWGAGEVIAFDDTSLHMARNPTNEERVVLIVDVDLGARPSEVLVRQNARVSWVGVANFGLMVGEFYSFRLKNTISKWARRYFRWWRGRA